MGQCSVCNVEQSTYVNVQHPLPFCGLCSDDRSQQHEASIVNQNVEPTEAINDGLNGALGLQLIGDVTLDREGRSTGALYFRDKFVKAILASGKDRNASAVLCK